MGADKSLDDDGFDAVPNLLHILATFLTEVLQSKLETPFVTNIVYIGIFVLDKLI